MNVPVATYRIQLSSKFGFDRLREIVPYLAELGISHIYASPIFKTPKKSFNGYNVTDDTHIDEGLGGQDGFETTIKEAAKHGLSWIQDIVPNHMAYTAENPMISDLIKRGSDSKFYNFFDVDWKHPTITNKILAPFLDKEYQDCLKHGELKLAYNNGFVLKHGNFELPLKSDSVTDGFKDRSKLSPKELLNRYNSDTKLLDTLIAKQIFKLAYWKWTLREINYRRFFDISELICLRQEQPDVFEATHKLIFKLANEAKFSGLRVDHIDGLRDPEKYLKMLKQNCPDAYIIVEKILARTEQLPDSWSIQGTTGYDFLNWLNSIFIDKQNEDDFNRIYTEFSNNMKDYDTMLYECKKHIFENYFGGEIKNLSRLFTQSLTNRDYGKNVTPEKLATAIIELVSSLNVYRTYLSRETWLEYDARQIQSTLQIALKRNEQAAPELSMIERLLQESKNSDDALACFMRLQQFTGVVMAKGFEDTMLYRYHRLLSLNDVGGSPNVFGIPIDDFNEFNLKRYSKWPFSINATATHDTKRGEDVRARLNILSEIPNEFGQRIKKWTELNTTKKKRIRDNMAPSKNEEYYLYQMLLGTYPFDSVSNTDYVKRVQDHIVKALREGKLSSSWFEPNEDYEDAVTSFINEILNGSDPEFVKDFNAFQKNIAFYGMFNSLSQTLLKITSPGVPDFYQGTELWDLNMVDPDNRRPVDFDIRRRRFDEIRLIKEKSPSRLRVLLDNYSDGRVKLFLIYKTLQARKRLKELFQDGKYIPLRIEGSHSNHLISFCRKKGRQSVIVVAPRFMTRLITLGELPLDDVWKNSRICLNQDMAKHWVDAFTGQTLNSRKYGEEDGLLVSDLLRDFPVTLLLQE
ncbi:MAG TPA: malto-oligosyltrehalose synthase [Candidatus Sulfotelmatobacter sp.]|nr:malto-oligosyltrehalose synthase [Candidatus Sulfotelmatobacter sp.]